MKNGRWILSNIIILMERLFGNLNDIIWAMKKTIILSQIIHHRGIYRTTSNRPLVSRDGQIHLCSCEMCYLREPSVRRQCPTGLWTNILAFPIVCIPQKSFCFHLTPNLYLLIIYTCPSPSPLTHIILYLIWVSSLHFLPQLILHHWIESCFTQHLDVYYK